MARLLVTSDAAPWYDELNAIGYYGETEFESYILQHMSEIFPECHVFPFKQLITDKSGISKKPDLAMIRKNYGGWYIIEIELVQHEIKHVLDQTRVFRYGEYNPIVVSEYIYDQVKKTHSVKLDKKKTRKLISSNSPSILVIVDSNREGWSSSLSKYNTDLCIFEVYKNIQGVHSYRIDGKYPVISTEESHCRPVKNIPNVLEILNPRIFKTPNKNEIQIFYLQKLTRWQIFTEKKHTYIRFSGSVNPLTPDTSYVISKDIRNHYYIRKN